MTKNMSSSMKKYHESTKPESCQTVKMFSFFFFFYFRRASLKIVTLSRWFSHITAAFYTEQCINSLLLQKNYGFICKTPFSSLVCMCTKYLAWIVIITQDWWIRNTVRVHVERERPCHPLLTRCLNRCLVSDSSANTAYIYWGSLWGQTFSCSVMANLCSSMYLLLKKSDTNKTKNIKAVTRCRDSRSAKSRESRQGW